MGKINAPWSDEQVRALNKWQRLGFVHEFTCPRDHDNTRTLLATRDGWVCHCGYTQSWAYDLMADETLHPEHPVRLPRDSARREPMSYDQDAPIDPVTGGKMTYRQCKERIAELEAALREMLMYADIAEDVTGVVYPCGTHADVIRRARKIMNQGGK